MNSTVFIIKRSYSRMIGMIYFFNFILQTLYMPLSASEHLSETEISLPYTAAISVLLI